MLSGSPPLDAAPLTLEILLAGGLRALLSMPSGVEEAVIELVIGGSDTERKEGIRGVFVDSRGGLAVSSESGDGAAGAKSWESSGAGGASFGGVAIVPNILSVWHEGVVSSMRVAFFLAVRSTRSVKSLVSIRTIWKIKCPHLMVG